MPSGIKPSPEIDAQMIDLYRSGLSEAKIASIVSLTSSGVHGALKRLGVQKRPARCKNNSPLTNRVKDRIVKTYLAGNHTYATARLIGVSQRSVCKTLIVRDIPFRTLESVNRNPGVIHDFFDSIDTDAKAWALGFLSADGWAVKNRNRLGLQVADKDAEVIEKFRSIVCPGVSPKKKTRYVESVVGREMNRYVNNVTLVWSSAQQVAALRKYGIVQRKSYSIVPWNGPSRLTPAYWRGLIDGDGTWATSRGRLSYLGLYGTKAIVAGFERFARDITGGKKLKLYHTAGNQSWRVHIGGGIKLRKIARVLYKDATIWLARKRAIAEHLLDS